MWLLSLYYRLFNKRSFLALHHISFFFILWHFFHYLIQKERCMRIKIWKNSLFCCLTTVSATKLNMVPHKHCQWSFILCKKKTNIINRVASCHVTSAQRNIPVEIWVEINAQLHSFRWQSCSSPRSAWTKCSVSTSPASHDTGSGQSETPTRSAARQQNSVLWHMGGFCTKIFSLEQTVMHLEWRCLPRYAFLYIVDIYTHKVWCRAPSSATSL